MFTEVKGQTAIPDSLLYQEWDESAIEYQSQAWTPGCDSMSHVFYPGKTFYYNADSLFHQMATRNFSEIVEEVRYFYFIVDLLNKRKDCPKYREKLVKASKHYKSRALEHELDVLDTYCYSVSPSLQSDTIWDYFWGLIGKYERNGDFQTKLRIMQRLLYVCSGFPTTLVSSQIKENNAPLIRLINEILSTQERMKDEFFIYAPSYFYSHIGLIYYDFKFFDKAIPLLERAAEQSIGHYYDRGVMRAKDYLGDYYSRIGDYNRSDSFYLSILKSPEQVIMRPIDNVVAIGGLAANANSRGWKDEAMRLYSIAMPQALQVKDSTLAGGYAIHLGRLYIEKGELDKTREMINLSREYLIAGDLPIRNWERFYVLNRDYYLKENNAEAAVRYIDSISLIHAQEEDIYSARILAYAEQEAFETERFLTEERLNKQKYRIMMISIILILCLLLLGVLFYFYRKLQGKNRDLFLRIKAQDSEAAKQENAWSHYESAGGSQHNEFSGNIRQRELFVRLRAYLLANGNFTKAEIDTNTLISELSTNRTYLFEAIKSFTGKTLQEYINFLRLEEGKRLLETTEETIEGIAEACGYNSVRTFYRLFRSSYNISPAVYRKIAKEQKLR